MSETETAAHGDPGLDLREEDLRVDVFRRGDGRYDAVRIAHLPTGCVAAAAGGGRSQIRLKEEALDELRWMLSLPPSDLARLNRCMCGSVHGLLKGQNSYPRMDIICPVCDGFDVPVMG